MSQPNDPFAPREPSSSSAYGSAPPLHDLPPVEAPSAGFIVQLFVIPAVVVFVVIGVWLLFGKLAGGERDAMEYVRLIRASATNWRAANRAAFELATLIQNDGALASDPKLLGELTDVLDHDLDRVENPEMTQYLALALGRFKTLKAETAKGSPVDPIATLAKALKATSPSPVRIAAAASLAQHAARLNGTLDDPRAVKMLAEASRDSLSDEGADLRQMAVYALGFFGGEAAGEALRDSVDHDPNRFVRYNAAVALARRGDPAATGTLREMLTPASLNQVITIESDTEKRNKIEAIELEALLALQNAADAGKPDLARALKPEITGLVRSDLASVSTNAQALLRDAPAASK